MQKHLKQQLSSIWPIVRTLSGANTSGQRELGSIPQSSSITGTSPSVCLVFYSGQSLLGGDLTPLQRSSRCILLPQPTGKTLVGKTWKGVNNDNNCSRKNLAEMKIQWDISQKTSLLYLLFVISMMPLNYILKNAQGYIFIKPQETINHLIYMDDSKYLQKRTGDPDVNNKYIQ